MGASTKTILGALLGRAFLIGLLGAGFTLAVAYLLRESLQSGPLQGFDIRSLQGEIPLVLLTTPILSCAASWLPAVHAANRDPAIILRND